MLLDPEPSWAAAANPAPVEGDFTVRNFKFASGETLPQLRIHYRTFGTPRTDAKGVVRNAVLDPARDRRQRREPGARGVRRRAVRARAAARCDAATSSCCPTTSGTATRASRATACTRASRTTATATWSQARVPAAHRGAEGESRAPRHGHLDGRHAHLAVGRAAPAVHGRADAAREPADPDRRAQPRVAAHWSSTPSATTRTGTTASTRPQPPSLRTALEMLWLMGSNPVLRQKEAPTLAEADRGDRHGGGGAASRPGRQRHPLRGAASLRLRSRVRRWRRSRRRCCAVNSADDLINPARAGHPRARDQARAARPRGGDPLQRADPRPRLAHLRGAVEGAISRNC